MYTGYLFCEACDAPTYHPIWARVEHLHYQALCLPCYAQLDQTFTAEQAIYHALIIVGIHQGKLGVQR
jgi:hypothetical protein